jgi:hypothetical protein
VAKLDADVWFRFHSESVSTAGADLQRLKDAAAVAGFDMRGAKVTPADEGESGPGWSSYVPLDPET